MWLEIVFFVTNMFYFSNFRMISRKCMHYSITFFMIITVLNKLNNTECCNN